MKLYRVENEDGDGPFIAFDMEDLIYNHPELDAPQWWYNTDDFPGWNLEQWEKPTGGRSLAFRDWIASGVKTAVTRDMIGHWFPPAVLRHLEQHGFGVAEYEAKPVALGRRQVLIPRDAEPLAWPVRLE